MKNNSVTPTEKLMAALDEAIESGVSQLDIMRAAKEKCLSVLAMLWVREDFVGAALNRSLLSVGETLSDEAIAIIVEALENNHDANIGINWEIIDNAIEFLLDEGVINETHIVKRIAHEE